MSVSGDNEHSDLSPLDAMEQFLDAISTGDLDVLEENSRKRRRTESLSETRPSTPPSPGHASADASHTHRPPTLNATQVAKQIIASKKRKTDHGTELLAFAELQDVERTMTLFDSILEIRVMLRNQFADNDNWTMSKNMKEDIRNYAQAVILAPAIPCYMPDGGSIQNLLKAKGIYPDTWTIFPSRLAIIRQYAGTCATETRADLKNSIKQSLKSGSCLSALCDSIVQNTEIKVTAAMRSRVAWLRFIYVNYESHRGAKFWEFVDEQLRQLRKKMNNDARRLAAAMAHFVTKDEEKFTVGDNEPYSLAEDGDLPQFQAAAHAAARAIVPPVPKTA